MGTDSLTSGFFAPLGDQFLRQAALFLNVALHQRLRPRYGLSRGVESQSLLVQVQDDPIPRLYA